MATCAGSDEHRCIHAVFNQCNRRCNSTPATRSVLPHAEVVFSCRHAHRALGVPPSSTSPPLYKRLCHASHQASTSKHHNQPHIDNSTTPCRCPTASFTIGLASTCITAPTVSQSLHHSATAPAIHPHPHLWPPPWWQSDRSIQTYSNQQPLRCSLDRCSALQLNQHVAQPGTTACLYAPEGPAAPPVRPLPSAPGHVL